MLALRLRFPLSNMVYEYNPTASPRCVMNPPTSPGAGTKASHRRHTALAFQKNTCNPQLAAWLNITKQYRMHNFALYKGLGGTPPRATGKN